MNTLKSGSSCEPVSQVGARVCRRRTVHASCPVPDITEEPSSGAERSRCSWGAWKADTHLSPKTVWKLN